MGTPRGAMGAPMEFSPTTLGAASVSSVHAAHTDCPQCWRGGTMGAPRGAPTLGIVGLRSAYAAHTGYPQC